MKVLVDTSVWLPALSNKSKSTNLVANPGVEQLAKLVSMEQSIFLLGLILFEIVRGFRNEKERKHLESQLKVFPLIELERDDYLYATQITATCRSSGLTLSTVDAIIAAAAIRYDCYLLTGDKDFDRIAKILPLRVLSD